MPKNIFGIGSYSYQYNTRDTFGFAMKATAGVVDGELRAIFKDPVTDSGEKRSARGLLAVHRDPDGRLFLEEAVCWDTVRNCAFEPVFFDGKLLRDETTGGRADHALDLADHLGAAEERWPKFESG